MKSTIQFHSYNNPYRYFKIINYIIHLLTCLSGESSAGKSSLINLILGEELLPHHVLNTTSTICELKYGTKKKLVAHHMSDNDKATTTVLESNENSSESFRDKIAPFVHLEQGDRDTGSSYKKVEIFWPHELLEVYST